MTSQVSYGDLQTKAREEGIDPDQPYDDLHDEIDVKTCYWCGNEFLWGWTERFCTDTCEVLYINEFHR